MSCTVLAAQLYPFWPRSGEISLWLTIRLAVRPAWSQVYFRLSFQLLKSKKRSNSTWLGWRLAVVGGSPFHFFLPLEPFFCQVCLFISCLPNQSIVHCQLTRGWFTFSICRSSLGLMPSSSFFNQQIFHDAHNNFSAKKPNQIASVSTHRSTFNQIGKLDCYRFWLSLERAAFQSAFFPQLGDHQRTSASRRPTCGDFPFKLQFSCLEQRISRLVLARLLAARC